MCVVQRPSGLKVKHIISCRSSPSYPTKEEFMKGNKKGNSRGALLVACYCVPTSFHFQRPTSSALSCASSFFLTGNLPTPCLPTLKVTQETNKGNREEFRLID